MLPPNIVNPFDYQKQAVYYGNEDAQYNAERLGAVYIKFDKKGENLDIVGYGIDCCITSHIRLYFLQSFKATSITAISSYSLVASAYFGILIVLGLIE